jgi:hypothetical protein
MHDKAHKQTDDFGISKACTPDLRDGLLRCRQILLKFATGPFLGSHETGTSRTFHLVAQVSVISVTAHSIQTPSTGSSPRVSQGAPADGDVLQKEAQVAGLRNASCL